MYMPCVHMEPRGQLSRSQFSSILTWIPRIEPRLSVLVASAFTYRTNLLAHPETLYSLCMNAVRMCVCVQGLVGACSHVTKLSKTSSSASHSDLPVSAISTCWVTGTTLGSAFTWVLRVWTQWLMFTGPVLYQVSHLQDHTWSTYMTPVMYTALWGALES